MDKLIGIAIWRLLCCLGMVLVIARGGVTGLTQETNQVDRGTQIVGDCLAILFVDSQQPACKPMELMATQAVENGWAFRRVEASVEKHLADRWRIHTTPTVVLLRSGREVDRILGVVSQQELMRRLVKSSSPDSIRVVQPVRGLENSRVGGTKVDTLVPMQQRPVSSEVPSRPTPPLGVSGVDGSAAIDPQAATVRIVVDEPESHAVGTGTIINSSTQGAVILTCGHLFRDWTRNSVIAVECFESGSPVRYVAELVDYQIEDVDIGVLVIRPGKVLPSVSVAGQSNLLREGDSVFSIGCDHGNAPTRRDSRVTKLNRYLGSPNIETAGVPVQGRSGGGLFNTRGELVGICFAADAELDEGLYCGTQNILNMLQKHGLSPAAKESIQTPRTATLGSSASGVAPSPALQAGTWVAPARMTVILTDSSGNTRQMTIDQPSEQLVDAMKLESQRALQAKSTSQVRWKIQKAAEAR